MNILRTILAVIRLLLFACVAVLMIVCVLGASLLRLPHKQIYRGFTAACAATRFVLNIRRHVIGIPPDVRGVIMCNHRSYIDIVLIPSAVPYVIVAKRQVRAWPIIGQAAVSVKTIFVDRDSPESRRRTRDAIHSRLSQGLSVLIFPEGTTHEGPGVLDYKPGMFHTCAAEGFPVIPAAVEFRDRSAAWVGDDTFIRHFIQTFGKWRTEVDLSIGTPFTGNDGDALRRKTQEWADAETRRMAAGVYKEK